MLVDDDPNLYLRKITDLPFTQNETDPEFGATVYLSKFKNYSLVDIPKLIPCHCLSCKIAYGIK